MVQMLLRYRTIKDTTNEYRIDKHAMRQHYMKENERDDSFDGLSSLHIDYKRKFPTNPVHIKWQDLQHLKSIQEAWLTNVGIHHQGEQMKYTADNPYALFAITKVDVSGNKIGTEFPTVFFKLPSLHCLMVSKNHISHFPHVKPDEFVCDNLEEFILDSNQIEELPGYLFTLPALRRFSAADNCLMEIPEEIWELPSLASLNLSNNKLNSLPQPRVPHQTQGMRRQSTMSNMSVTSSMSEPSSMLDQVFDNAPSESEVKHSTIWSDSLVVIENEFDYGSRAYKQKGLQELNLAHNHLSEIPVWLCCSSPFLENLNLSNNRIKSAGKVFQYPQYLKTLDLSNNKLEDTVSWQDTEGGISTCYSRM